jgi:hypothetical protein
MMEARIACGCVRADISCAQALNADDIDFGPRLGAGAFGQVSLVFVCS